MTVLYICNPMDAAAELHAGRRTNDLSTIEVCDDLHLTLAQADALKTLRRRIDDRLRKQKSRAAKPVEVLLPLPQGTGDALARVMEAAGFDDARDFLAFQIHRLDHLLQCDGHAFKAQAVRTVTAGDLSHYTERLQTEGRGDV